MGKFGTLFRKSDEKDKAEPANQNPYSHATPTDRYAQANSSAVNANRQISSGLPSAPRPGGAAPPPYTQSPSPYPRGSSTLSTDPKKDSRYGTNSPGGSSAGSAGYVNDRFGAQGGYGSNRYDNSAAHGRNDHSGAAPQRTAGGYGGLGDGDNELFTGYKPRPKDAQGTRSSQPGETYGEWGTQQDQQEMTEEERADAEIRAKKREINQVRLETEDTMDRILGKIDYGNQQAEQAYETLGRQGEVLHNANRAIGEASVQARIAEANVKDLQDANKSMFNFYAMSRKRRDGLNDERLVAELQEKEDRQRLQREAQQAKSRTNERMQTSSQRTFNSGGAANHSKYIFEEDSDGEQEARERRINDKTERAFYGVQQLHRTAQAIGAELEDQDPIISSLSDKTSRVHDKVLVNHNKIQPYK